jgi:hypothetical protein
MDAPWGEGVVDALLVARALRLLDEGSVADARELLAAALSGSDGRRSEGAFEQAQDAGFEPFADAELESAFEDARPETDAMIDADGIAIEAIRRARLDAPESVSLPSPDSPFHTRTMADLLERQGDVEGARTIRRALDEDSLAFEAVPSGVGGGAARTRTIQTLERWLARLRGGDA